MLIGLLSFLPILILLLCLLVFKMPASKAGALSFLSALLISLITFRPGIEGLSIMLSKGFGLALFVIFIIWGAVFLYNVVKEVGALEVINKNMQIVVEDRYVQFMLLTWVFAPFLQGIAGFGIPVIVVTPILVAMGFEPVISAAGVLLGHSWAISFGSMGSSVYAIDMVTDAPLNEITNAMAVYGTISMLVIGVVLSVMYGGMKALKTGIWYLAFATTAMSMSLFISAKLGMISVIGLMAGTTGLVTMLTVYKVRSRKTKVKSMLYKADLNIIESALPYILIVILSIVFYVISPKLIIDMDFSGFKSGTGIIIAEERGYVSFNVLKYPFCIIMLASLVGIALYVKKGCFKKKNAKNIIEATIQKCIPTTITLVLLLCMAQIMMDSQMIATMASALVNLTGEMYPVASPFIGLLGAFITGSNTNSNILFGALQESSAVSLGLSASVMCAAQSLGASVGGAIGPTTVALGATSAHIYGKETEIYRYTLTPVLACVFIQGMVNLIFLNAG